MFRILIADDHPIVRKGLVHVLEDSGIVRSIEEASNGQEGLDKVKRSRFDVVLLDVAMPGMGGMGDMGHMPGMGGMGQMPGMPGVGSQ
mgnify:CR=1 FL=1